METAEAESLAIAEATASSLRQFLAQAEAGLTNASAGLGMEFVTGTPCDNSMQTLANIILFVSSATTVDRDGRLLCSAEPIPEGASSADWVWFRPMADDPGYFVGDSLLSDLSGTWVLPLVAPVLDEQGQFAGAIAGAVSLFGFAELMSGDRQDEVLVTIETADHIVIARSLNAEQWVGQPLPPRRGTDELVAPGRSIARGPDFEDIERAWGQIELENGWWVYVGVPAETIFGPARAAAARQISATLLVLLVGMLFAGFSYRRISSALRELASGVLMTRRGARPFTCLRGPRRSSGPSFSSSTRRCRAESAPKSLSEPRASATSRSSTLRSSACP